MKKFAFIFLVILLFSPSLSSAQEQTYDAPDYLSRIGYLPYTKGISTGKGVVVAVIDDGVWLEHPELKNNIWTNPNEISQNSKDDDQNTYKDDHYGWNFIDANSNVAVKGTHGTAVAGVVHKIAPDAKIMSLIVCGASGCAAPAVQQAIKYAADMGANVINLSLGGQGYLGYDTSFDESIKYAYNKGVVIVSAAGNGDSESLSQLGQNLDFIKVSPVSNDVEGINMVVGAGANNGITPLKWSNYGGSVDVWAPGEDIFTTVVPSFSDGLGYDFLDGTSFSSPMVAGAVALLRSVHPDWKNWQIVDYIKLNSNLNINGMFSASLPACTYNSFAPSKISSGESVSVKGGHFTSQMRPVFFDSVKNVTISIPTNAINFLDANNLKINTQAITLPPGNYVLQDTNSLTYPCRTVGSEYFTVLNSPQPVVLEPPVAVSVPKDSPMASNPQKTSAVTIFSCMGNAVAIRQASIKQAFDIFSIAQADALAVQEKAFQNAWNLLDVIKVRKAVNGAVNLYRAAHRAAVKKHAFGVNAAWQQYTKAVKLCKPTKTVPVETINYADNSLAQ